MKEEINNQEKISDLPQAEERSSAACEPLLCAEPDGETVAVIIRIWSKK